MQDFFPEGFYFCHALHGLTWVEAALRDSTLTPTAIPEIKRAIAALDSPQGKSPFPADLPPDHGMFYSAWKADLQAGLVLLTDGQDAVELDRLRSECDMIDAALENSPSPFLAFSRLVPQ